MSYALSVFLVPRSRLDQAFGRGDSRLLAEALEATRQQLASYDEQMGAPDLENCDVDLSHSAALREIFFGKFTDGVSGSRYGWAFETLCGFLGERLDNTGFSPCRMEWYERLDDTLVEHAVPLRFDALISRCPIAIPPADDWPCVGHWGAEEYSSVGSLERSLPLVDDSEQREALQTALEWLRAGAQSSECLVVGFHG